MQHLLTHINLTLFEELYKITESLRTPFQSRSLETNVKSFFIEKA